jgi:hypothetical protein
MMIVSTIQGEFADRLRAIYLAGSYAYGTPVAANDLDMHIITTDAGRSDDAERIDRLESVCSILAATKVDLMLCSLDRLLRDDEQTYLLRLTLKTDAIFVAGDDVRDQITLPQLDHYQRWISRAPFINSAHVLRQTNQLTYPLDYPDPSGEFYGYDLRRTDNVYSPTGRGTKDLVSLICWTATARLAIDACEYVGSKAASIQRYQECIHDEWNPFIGAVYETCRSQWGYLVPERKADRAFLRELCHQTLAFENAYIARYRDFVLEQIDTGDAAIQSMMRDRLHEMVYPGTGIA